jgi:hypothetical protein
MKRPLAALTRRSLAHLVVACVADFSTAGVRQKLVALSARRYNRRTLIVRDNGRASCLACVDFSSSFMVQPRKLKSLRYDETMALQIKPKEQCKWDLVTLGEVMLRLRSW